MNRFLLLIILFSTTQICLSQKKKSPAPAKKTPVTEIKEEKDVPIKLLNLAPSRLVSKDVISKARSMGASVSGGDFKIPTSSEKRFMYDDFVLYGENQESYLVNINGNVEKIPADTRLITTTKNNSKILVDKCLNQSELAKCYNIRIIDNMGKNLDINLSKYYYMLNMQENLYNSESNSYVIVHSNSGSENIITDNGTTIFANDVSGISFIIPGFATYDEGGKEKLMELSTKKNIDISVYEDIYSLPVNKLLVGKQNGKYLLFNPSANKILFESDKAIREVYALSDVNPKNYFIIGDYDQPILVDIRGKRIFEEDYARFMFYFEGNKFVVEDKQGKQNYYDLEKKAFVYRAFYNSLSTVGAFDVAKYNNYCEIYDNKTSAFLYGENKDVKDFSSEGDFAVVKYNDYCQVYDSKTNTLAYGENKNIKNFRSAGNMFVITKQVDPTNSVVDIYDKSSRSIIYENVTSLRTITDTDKYFALNKGGGPENKYSIVDRDGKVLIQEIIIPNFIKYNIDKGTFELTKTMYGKTTGCYDKTGLEIKCK